MASRWVKAAFLAVLGIVILFFADKLVADLRVAAEGNLDVTFEWTWSLLTWLLWVLVAWLFVDAGLTIALSFTEQGQTIGDVAKRLGRIERKLGVSEQEEDATTVLGESGESAAETADEQPSEEEPPPPAV